MKAITTLVILLSFLATAWAQPPEIEWTHTFAVGEASDVRQTTDGGYIIVGSRGDFWVVKTDSEGNLEWNRAYGGANDDMGGSIYQTSDGGYIVTGTTWSFGIGTPNYGNIYLVRTDSQGDTLWTRVYGGNRTEYARSVQQTTDGGFVIAGSSGSYPIGAPNEDFYLIKTDSAGNSEWTRTYGGTGYDDARSVQQTTDGGYVLAGWTGSFGAGMTDFFLVKTDSNGDTLWTRTYGGINLDEAWSVQQKTDGGYILGGETWSYGSGAPSHADFYLVNTDSQGDVLWTRNYGGINDDRGRSVQQTTDGSFIITGSTQSFGAGQGDYYMVHSDESGDTTWTLTAGGTVRDWAMAGRQTGDGGYVLVGTTGDPFVNLDIYLVKTAQVFTPSPLRIITPNGGENWTLFTNRIVTWASDGIDGLIRIELNRSYPAGTWEVLTESTEDDNQESFYVNTPLSSTCRIRISLIGDTLQDISNDNFLITKSDGVLELVNPSQPGTPISNWYAGGLITLDTLSASLRLKNFGDEEIVIFTPEEPVSEEFSIVTACDSMTLAPGEMSQCALTLLYHPQTNGEHFDTLLIRTNADNSDVDNYFRLVLNGQLTLQAADDLNSEPLSYALLPVYPNPFNSAAQIQYTVPMTSQVKLSVFNLLGEEVAVLVHGVQVAGLHRVSFDGMNFSSGVYLCRLQTEGFMQTRKMMLLK